MGRYEFTNPAANASAGVREVLDKHRELKRQAMLDEMAMKDAESRRAVQAAGIRATDANIKETEAGIENDIFSQSLIGRQMGDDLSQLDPKVREMYTRRGLERPAQMQETPVAPVPFQSPQVGDEGGLEGPMEDLGQAVQPKFSPSGFVGTRDEQERDRRVKAAGKVMENFQKNPEMSLMERIAALAELEASGVNLDSGTYTAMTKTPKKRYTFDQDTGKYSKAMDEAGDEIPEDAQITTHSRPPRPLQQPAPQIIFSGDGKQMFQLPRGGNELKPIGTPEGVESFGRSPAPKGGAGTTEKPVVANTQLNQFNILKGKAVAGKPADVAAFNQALESMLINYKVSDDAKSAIRGALVEEDDSVPTSEVVQHLSEDFPSEISQISRFLYLVRGQ